MKAVWWMYASFYSKWMGQKWRLYSIAWRRLVEETVAIPIWQIASCFFVISEQKCSCLLVLYILVCFVYKMNITLLKRTQGCRNAYTQHRRSQGGTKGPCPPKFLENIVICALRGVFLNKIMLFAWNQTFWPPQIFGLATPLIHNASQGRSYLVCATNTQEQWFLNLFSILLPL